MSRFGSSFDSVIAYRSRQLKLSKEKTSSTLFLILFKFWWANLKPRVFFINNNELDKLAILCDDEGEGVTKLEDNSWSWGLRDELPGEWEIEVSKNPFQIIDEMLWRLDEQGGISTQERRWALWIQKEVSSREGNMFCDEQGHRFHKVVDILTAGSHLGR